MASKDEAVVYCICKKPYDESKFMIECDVCNDWFHGTCIELEERRAADIEIYHCPVCQLTHGPLVLKQKRLHRRKHYYSEDGDFVFCGTVKFVKKLRTRKFDTSEKVPTKLRGYQLDKAYLEENGFNYPILVNVKDGLDLRVPPSTFTVDDVELAVGSMRELDVIDVAKQADMKMLMREWVQYYNNPVRDRIYNVISLEFSSTSLSQMVTPPRIITEVSWVSNYWPDQTGDVKTFIKPEVQKYCLMSVKDSYTDFHIDFGGTSVWYHIIRGKKVFYLIEPTPGNVAMYEAWASSSEQNQIFFGDQVKQCYKVEIRQGNTLFIPTGWIHAVYTPEDSLVFGGNFLHNYRIGLQLDIYEIERRINTPEKFLFPNFETTCWYAAKHLADLMKECVDEGKTLCKRVLDGCWELTEKLKDWLKPHQHALDLKRHKEYMPEGLSHSKLLKALYSLLEQLRTDNVESNTIKTQTISKSLRIVKAKKHQKRKTLDNTLSLLAKNRENTIKKQINMTTVAKDTSSLDKEKSHQNIGLKLKLAGGSIQHIKPESDRLSNASDSDTDQLVVDDSPVSSMVKYRFSLGGKNIQDLSSQSTSDDLRNSKDDNEFLIKSTISNPSKSENRQIAWSKGIENLIKASSHLKSKKTSSRMKPESFTSLLTPSQPPTFRLGSSLPEDVFKPRKPDAAVQSGIRSLPEEEEEEAIKTCFKDDTYVYPTLADSDDDEVKPMKKRKSNRDDNWCPKSKVRALPSDFKERPHRPLARRESVESGLKMASQHLQDKMDNKRRHVKKTPSTRKSVAKDYEKWNVTASKSILQPSSSAPASLLHMAGSKGKDIHKEKRMKKGFTTTKQRLGKLLKIHKMPY